MLSNPDLSATSLQKDCDVNVLPSTGGPVAAGGLADLRDNRQDTTELEKIENEFLKRQA
jgi:hypothetical protein